MAVIAKDGYKVKVTLTDKRDSFVYLAYYYGKQLPTIFKIDSAKLDKNQTVFFEKKEKITGGIYIILPQDKSSYFEFLLNNGDDFSIVASMKDLPEGIKYKNSQENTDYIAYQSYLKSLAEKQQKWQKDYAASKTAKDSADIRDKYQAASDELMAYRKKYEDAHQGSILASIFKAMQTPKVPEGTHYLPDRKVDSNFGYYYYKAHYWDGFNLKDDRLIHTPLLEMKLEEYFNKILIQQEDTICMYADTILNRMKGTQDLYKFTLNWLSTNAQTSKVMGMDKVFVYLVENYYMKGVATWLGTEDLKKFIDRANELAPTLMNKKAADFTGIDVNKKELNMYNVKSKYTLVIFYDPDCGHCQGEMPHLDSLYRAYLKTNNVKVIAFNVDKEEQKWKDFIKKYNIGDWINMYDPERKSLYWRYYDVQATPSIYLLDEGKYIRGKKLDYTTISKAIEINEMRRSGKLK